MIAAADDNAEAGSSVKRRKGYIVLHRDILDSAAFQDAGLFRLLVYLKLRAAHKARAVTIRTGRGTKTVEIGVGQVLVGIPSLAEKLRTPKTTIRRWLSRLKADRQIAIKADTHYSIVTIATDAPYQNAKPKGGQANGQASGAATGHPTGHPTGHIQSITKDSLSKKPSSPKLRFDTEDREFAEFMLTGIRKLQPEFRQPRLEAWANDVRLAREIDGRTLEELRGVWRWANADAFWQSNVLSPATLRKQFDQLKIKSKGQTNGSQRNESAARIRTGPVEELNIIRAGACANGS